MSIYVVIDVEFDGPQPGLNSMISLMLKSISTIKMIIYLGKQTS